MQSERTLRIQPVVEASKWIEHRFRPASRVLRKLEDSSRVTTSTWLYALQAVKTSVTVWGIWLGHVYRLHMVTAAMQMTMFQRLPPVHPVRQVLGRQSEYLIPFDVILLIDWSIGPPTSIATSIEFLKLIDTFAAGRTFFEDDPQATLDALGLLKTDFSNPLFSMSEITPANCSPV